MSNEFRAEAYEGPNDVWYYQIRVGTTLTIMSFDPAGDFLGVTCHEVGNEY